MEKIRIFIVSPNDVSEERDIVSFVVQELRRTIGDIRKIELEPVRWETHSWPDIGEDAQDVINKQIGEYDVLVGIMWKRFGTPTNRANSGTGEEFEIAYKLFVKYKRPKIMFYFRNTPFYTTDLNELSQFRKVIYFRKKLEKLGVLFAQYNEPIEFERNVREHLIKQILQLSPPAKLVEPVTEPKLFLSCVREDTSRVIPIYKSLKAAGFRPWLDVEDILPGQSWDTIIRRAISESDFFILFISENTFSRAGYVNKEIRLALDVYDQMPEDAQYLIPVRLDPVNVPAALSRFQWLDYFAPTGLDTLINTIRSAWKTNRQ